MQVRDATAADVAAINHIYNATAVTTTVAWAEKPEALDARRHWFVHQQSVGNPVLVAEDDRVVIGYASYSDFRDTTKWPGYRFTVEHSVHVAELHHRSGVGRAMMEELVHRATAQGKHVMIGAIAADNASSIRFHQNVGFSEVGRLPAVGFKFGRWLDLVLMHRPLG